MAAPSAVPPPARPSVTVVVPVFGNESTLRELNDRVLSALGQVAGDLEIIYVDDLGPDASWQVIRDLCTADSRIRGLALARNVGPLTAIAAGCQEARGDVICSIDADLENRPEDLVLLVEAICAGRDLVSAVRVQQGERPLVRRVGSTLTRLAVGGAWAFHPRDFGCGMKAWRRELSDEANRALPENRDVAWAIGLFSAARSYGEVDTPFDHQRRRSGFTLGRKSAQAVLLLATLHPARAQRLRHSGTVLLLVSGVLVWRRKASRKIPAALGLLGILSAVCGQILVRARRETAIGDPVEVRERC